MPGGMCGISRSPSARYRYSNSPRTIAADGPNELPTSRARSLPAIAERPFRDTFRAIEQPRCKEKAVLYAGCLVDFAYPRTGEAGQPRCSAATCLLRRPMRRAAAFLFIWQFLISGPLELASGLIAIATFAPSFHPVFRNFNDVHTISHTLELSADWKFSVAIGPAKLFALGLGILVVVLLYRRVTTLGKLTILFWIGVLAAMIRPAMPIGWRTVMAYLFGEPLVEVRPYRR